MRFPDFFIVGASKTGTTAVCEALAKHPEICFSEVKEPNFFDSFDTSLKEIPSDKLSQYQSLFHVQSPMQQLGEGSVKYLDSLDANYWIRKYVPSAKIVIILRNPVQRIVSLYEMYTRIGIMKMGREEAFSVSSYLTRQCLLYQKILAYIDHFSREQVLIMVFDDFLKHEEQAFQKLCQFLGCQYTPEMTWSSRNKGGVPKSGVLSILSSRRLVEVAKRILPRSTHGQIDNFVKSTFFKKTSLDPIQKETLEQFFYEDVEKIGALIDRDLCAEWKLPGVPVASSVLERV